MDFAPLVSWLQAIPGMAERVGIAATIDEAIRLKIQQDRYLWLAAPYGQSQPNTVIGAIHQEHEVKFSVVALVRNVADPAGAAALTAMAVLRESVLDALLGQSPAADYERIEHVRDAIVQWGEGKLYWADEFKTSHYLSN